MLRLFRNWFNYVITVVVHGRQITTSSTAVRGEGRRSQTRRKLCGTKTLLVFLFTLTLLVNLQFKVVDIGDYYSLTFSHDNFRGPCVLPILNPFDPGMMRGFKKLDSINCMQPEPPVFFDSANVLQYNQSELVRRGLRSDMIQCRCSDVIRVNGDDWVEFSEDYECKIPFGYKQDFLKIKCKANSDTIFDSLLFKIHKKKSFGELRDDYYNVLLFGIDTVSRSSSIRNLENTLKYIKGDLGAFDFKGYMKIGGVTYPNIVAVLTGMLENELPIKDEINDFFDDIPAVWKNYSQNNYTTFYAEDLPLMNTFNLKKKGFRQSPVDHYMRPYWLGWHAINPVRDYKGGVSLDLLNVGLLKLGLEKYLCAGHVPNYVAQLQYLKRFFDTYNTERKFAFSFLVEIAHNNQNILNLADTDIYKFFKGLQEDGHLENTIVFVFSDHGPKTGETFYTARVEKSLPMQYIILPEKLKQSYPQIPKHLAENAKKLTTHFDLYATLRDVLHRNFRSPTKFVKNGAVRGYSLFGQMPAERSCAEAFVPEHFCVCYKSSKVRTEGNQLIYELAEAVVHKLNHLLSAAPQCSKLKLNNVISADMVSEAQKAVYTKNSINVIRPKLQRDLRQKYLVVIETMPGEGQFFATCVVKEGQPVEVLDEIDRVNRYNNQSHCVDDRRLRTMCYCKQQ